MRRRLALLIPFMFVIATAVGIPGAASAAPGFDVRIVELPGQLAAGQGASGLTVVASTDVGRFCRKVRWSMVMRVSGLALDQVRVDRIEQNGSVPLDISREGDTARLTDVQLDPGTLCRGRTVTAQYQIAIDDASAEGEVTFLTEAYDSNERLLQRATATRAVVTSAAGLGPDEEPSEEPSEEPGEEPSEEAGTGTDEPEEAQPAPEEESTGPAAAAVSAARTGGTSDLLLVGLAAGALLIFLGVGLLFRVRQRARATGMPTVPRLPWRRAT